MRVLLDTHAVIWWVDQDHLLGAAARAAITDPANELFLSAATVWEIAIQVGLGKLSLSMPYRQCDEPGDDGPRRDASADHRGIR